MEAANERWRQKQEEIDRANPSDEARADLEAIRDQIDDIIYKLLLGWIDRGEYLRQAQEKIEFLADFHRNVGHFLFVGSRNNEMVNIGLLCPQNLFS